MVVGRAYAIDDESRRRRQPVRRSMVFLFPRGRIKIILLFIQDPQDVDKYPKE
jgi:hypothetical protein